MVLRVFKLLLNSYYFAFIMWKKLIAFHILYYVFFSPYSMVRHFGLINIYNDGKFEFSLSSMFLRFSSMTPETSEELWNRESGSPIDLALVLRRHVHWISIVSLMLTWKLCLDWDTDEATSVNLHKFHFDIIWLHPKSKYRKWICHLIWDKWLG